MTQACIRYSQVSRFCIQVTRGLYTQWLKGVSRPLLGRQMGKLRFRFSSYYYYYSGVSCCLFVCFLSLQGASESLLHGWSRHLSLASVNCTPDLSPKTAASTRIFCLNATADGDLDIKYQILAQFALYLKEEKKSRFLC